MESAPIISNKNGGSQKDIQKDNFRWEREQQNVCETTKIEWFVKSLVQPYIMTKRVNRDNRQSRKSNRRILLTGRTSCDLCFEGVVKCQTKLPQCLFGHKIERISAQKEVDPSNWQKISQISLCTWRRISWNSVDKSHEMSNSADEIRLWFQIYAQCRADTPRCCLEQTRIWWLQWQLLSLFCSRQYLFCSMQPLGPVWHQNSTGIKLTAPRCHQKKKSRN